MSEKPRKLLDQVRDTLRIKHHSHRTEQSYIDRIRRYIPFNQKRHPRDLGEKEIRDFLAHLATDLTDIGRMNLHNGICKLSFLLLYLGTTLS